MTSQGHALFNERGATFMLNVYEASASQVLMTNHKVI